MSIIQQLKIILDENPTKYTSVLKKDLVLLTRLQDTYGDLPIKELFYCGLNNIQPPICKYNNKQSFHNVTNGYRKSCKPATSCKCLSEHRKNTIAIGLNAIDKNVLNNKRSVTNLERYGVEHVAQNNIIKEKIKQTNLDKYGVDSYSKTDEYKSKNKQTNLERYNVEHPIQNEDIKEKVKKTNLEKYGVEHVAQNDVIKQKTKQTNLDKYGVEYVLQHKDIKEKIKKTNLDRYGVDYISKSPKIQQKKIQNNIKKYGVEHYTQTDNYKETRQLHYYENIAKRVKSLYTPMFDINEYDGGIVDNKIKYYNWKCNLCNNIFKDHISSGRIPRCYNCQPKESSTWELELQEYIKQYIDIEANTKQVISPYELDIHIPSKNIAIECNGSYWHSELNGKDKTYHLNKTMLCEEQNNQLLHIWEHEYKNNPELIKSLIKAKLGLNDKIYARKTQIQVVDNKTKDLFLDNNHLQGTCPSKHNIGLYYENELVALMTFGNPRFNKKYEWELIRYCSKQNINVIGGASKLFKHFIKTYNPTNVISYADRRYSNGNMYKQLGFTFINNSPPNFKYTKDYKTMYNRLQFQKHKLNEKLDVFDNTLTAEQNISNAGYDKLWDCGNSVWEWIK